MKSQNNSNAPEGFWPEVFELDEALRTELTRLGKARRTLGLLHETVYGSWPGWDEENLGEAMHGTPLDIEWRGTRTLGSLIRTGRVSVFRPELGSDGRPEDALRDRQLPATERLCLFVAVRGLGRQVSVTTRGYNNAFDDSERSSSLTQVSSLSDTLRQQPGLLEPTPDDYAAMLELMRTGLAHFRAAEPDGAM